MKVRRSAFSRSLWVRNNPCGAPLSDFQLRVGYLSGGRAAGQVNGCGDVLVAMNDERRDGNLTQVGSEIRHRHGSIELNRDLQGGAVHELQDPVLHRG